ncbi:MAG: molecular chaperone HtpG [Clostridiales bacterium]|nr:molecular chaperone HtpG [Clostridiales bacterium]
MTNDIKINRENIFKIIKKWLYSDKDIFIREVISNSVDAISKLDKLAKSSADITPAQPRIDILVDADAKTLSITDTGLGMTAEEVDKYINEIAFSGATDFAEKYKDITKDPSADFIGHFGLGFYSVFMVSTRVEIDTLSYAPGARAVHWESETGETYEISDSTRTQVGTTITLHIAPDSEEFLNLYRVREVVRKYCRFMPYEIYVEDTSPKEPIKDADGKEKAPYTPQPINDTHPLWLKAPGECTKDEYVDFYRKVFMDYNEPLFWIHLNVDFPFRLKGILYFPKLSNKFDTLEGTVKLFNNQVFIADNIKEVIPEFLMLLKGCIDSPDIPLNVSRSALQNDGTVTKIAGHITKKVAEKLKSLFNNERESYNSYWSDINVFVKYGCLKDRKFYDSIKPALIFKTTADEYKVIEELIDTSAESNTLYYVTDKDRQSSYIRMLNDKGSDAVYLDTIIDNQFITMLENEYKGLKFLRVDSAAAMNNADAPSDEAISALFKSALNDDKISVEAKPMGADATPAILLIDEESRRMREMYAQYMQSMNSAADIDSVFPLQLTLTVNTDSKLVNNVCAMEEGELKSDLIAQIYDMARLSAFTITPENMEQFITRTKKLLERL